MSRDTTLEFEPQLSGIRAMLTDWDDTYAFSRGTKDNPGPKIAHHQDVARSFYGFELSLEVIDEHWGKGLRVEMPHFYGHPAGVTHEEMLEAFESLDHKYPKTLLPGALELHEAAGAAGLMRGIVTSHLTKNAEGEVGQTALDVNSFYFIHGFDTTLVMKPDPRAFEPAVQVLSEHGIDPEQAVYIGDSLTDASAVEAGMQFIGVATGRTELDEFLDNGFHAEANLRQIGKLLLPHQVQFGTK